MTLDGRGKIDQVRLTLTGAVPSRASEAEQQMHGELPLDALFNAAAQSAAKDLEQDSDIHASAEYRRSACAAMAARALAQAAQRAAALAQESHR